MVSFPWIPGGSDDKESACNTGDPGLIPGSVNWHISHLRSTLAGVLLCISVHQTFAGAASLLFSCLCWCVGRGRLWGWLQPLWVTQQYRLAPWLPSFPPQAFPTTVSSLTSPQSISAPSTAALTLGLLHNPYIQLPATAPSRGPVSLSAVCMAGQGLSDSHSI